MEKNLLNSIQGLSLADLLTCEQMDSICATLTRSTGKYPRVRRFRPFRGERPYVQPTR